MKSIILNLLMCIIFLCSSCLNRSTEQNSGNKSNQKEMLSLINKLENSSYVELFMNADATPDSYFQFLSPYASTHLLKLIEDEEEGSKASFLAAELLFQIDYEAIEQISKEKLSRIYTQALLKNHTNGANAWGMPFNSTNLGLAGIRFLFFGEDATPSLLDLLSNDELIYYYIGSEEAIVGDMEEYKFHDFGAWYLINIYELEQGDPPVNPEEKRKWLEDIKKVVTLKE